MENIFLLRVLLCRCIARQVFVGMCVCVEVFAFHFIISNAFFNDVFSPCFLYR